MSICEIWDFLECQTSFSTKLVCQTKVDFHGLNFEEPWSREAMKEKSEKQTTTKSSPLGIRCKPYRNRSISTPFLVSVEQISQASSPSWGFSSLFQSVPLPSNDEGTLQSVSTSFQVPHRPVVDTRDTPDEIGTNVARKTLGATGLPTTRPHCPWKRGPHGNAGVGFFFLWWNENWFIHLVGWKRWKAGCLVGWMWVKELDVKNYQKCSLMFLELVW